MQLGHKGFGYHICTIKKCVLITAQPANNFIFAWHFFMASHNFFHGKPKIMHVRLVIAMPWYYLSVIIRYCHAIALPCMAICHYHTWQIISYCHVWLLHVNSTSECHSSSELQSYKLEWTYHAVIKKRCKLNKPSGLYVLHIHILHSEDQSARGS